MKPGMLDTIMPESVNSLAGLFHERVRRTPKSIAYRYFDQQSHVWRDISWAGMAAQIGRWQAAMERESLHAGDRVAVMLHNCCQWVMFDQAALALGLVVVPLYVNDRADNIAYILEQTSARILLIAGHEHWRVIQPVLDGLDSLQRIITLEALPDASSEQRLRSAHEWLPEQNENMRLADINPAALATIVYTSGTTGRPKGVMLSHQNIIWNAYSSQRRIDVYCSCPSCRCHIRWNVPSVITCLS
jgi:long-chain acyl-CoA synthetase